MHFSNIAGVLTMEQKQNRDQHVIFILVLVPSVTRPSRVPIIPAAKIWRRASSSRYRQKKITTTWCNPQKPGGDWFLRWRVTLRSTGKKINPLNPPFSDKNQIIFIALGQNPRFVSQRKQKVTLLITTQLEMECKL